MVMRITVATFNDIPSDDYDYCSDYTKNAEYKKQCIEKRLLGRMPKYAGKYLILTEKQYNKYFEICERLHYDYEHYLRRLSILYPIEVLRDRGIPGAFIENNLKMNFGFLALDPNSNETKTALKLNVKKVLGLMKRKKSEYENSNKKCGFSFFFNWEGKDARIDKLLN